MSDLDELKSVVETLRHGFDRVASFHPRTSRENLANARRCEESVSDEAANPVVRSQAHSLFGNRELTACWHESFGTGGRTLGDYLWQAAPRSCVV